VVLGEIKISQPGICTLELKPDKAGWKGFDLHRLTLVPTPSKTNQP